MSTGLCVRSVVFFGLVLGVVSGLSAGWEPPQRMDLDGIGDARDARIAAADSGLLAVVWRQENDVYVNRWDGTSWAGANLVSEGTGAALSVAVDLNDAGHVLVAWIVNEDSSNRIYSTNWDGSAWSQAEIISLNQGATVVEIALDDSGVGTAVFQQVDDEGFRIYANRWQPSTGWGTPEPLSINPEFAAAGPQVSMGGNGEALALWQQFDGDSVRAYANRWSGSGWQGAEAISPVAEAATTPSGSMNQAGDAVVIWRLSDVANRRIQTSFFDGTNWSVPLSIDPGLQRLTGPRIGLAGDGKAVAAWRIDESGNRRVYGNTRHGGTWGEALLLDDGVDTNISNAELAVDRAGRAFVVWNQSDGTRTRTVARRWDGSNWLPVEPLDNGLNPTFNALIALAGEGSGAAAWLESVNGDFQVFVARFDFDPIFTDRFESEGDAVPADAGVDTPSAPQASLLGQ